MQRSGRQGLFVCSTQTDRVLRFDGKSGRFLGAFALGGGLSSPQSLAFGPDGHLYVSSFTAVLRFDGKTGAFRDVFVPSGTAHEPAGLVFGPEGGLYVAARGGVLRFDGRSGAPRGVFAGGLNRPRALAFGGPEGDLFVADERGGGRGVIQRYRGRTGEPLGTVTTVEDLMTGLCFGPDGALYVAGYYHGVARYPGAGPSREIVIPAGSGGLGQVGGLTFGPDGCLYVSSARTESILSFYADSGAFRGTFAAAAGELKGAAALAFGPAPAAAAR
jgi:streptogramin lyase